MKESPTAVELVPGSDVSSSTEPTTSVAGAHLGAISDGVPRVVTFRSFVLGIFFTGVLAWFNCYMATKFNVHSFGGIQMPFSSIFVLMVFALLSLALRKLNLRGVLRPYTPTELLTMYSMMVFGAIVSTPGCDNSFLTSGPVLFYFATPENGWADLFYKYVPAWFAPGWDGVAYKKEVIDPIYLGQVSFDKIPWDAWLMMLTGWGIFLGLIYAVMFFTALLFRKQWTQREALAFPLVELPAQMAGAEGGTGSISSAAFWGDRLMWTGFGLAFFWHAFRGLNALWPDWPIAPVNSAGGMPFIFTERPLNVIAPFSAEVFLGGIGLAYLLTREVSFSFWFFFLFVMLMLPVSEVMGFQIGAMEKVGILGSPGFVVYQTAGGWMMMAVILAWTARESLTKISREAFGANRVADDEPFSPRFMLFGFILSFAGLLGWSWFAGINVFVALVFFAIVLMTSLVVARVVVEGGFMFPQPTFYTLEMMTQTMFGGPILKNAALYQITPATLTKLGFIQPMLMVDMRTSVLPVFMHTMKIAEVLRLDRKNLRRLLIACVVALALTVVITMVTSLQVLYSQGGLAGYTWFSKAGPEATFNSISGKIKSPVDVDYKYVGWMVFGATMVYLMVLARSRFLWFPLHPLGYLMSAGYPIRRLWFSFFVGWLLKTLIMKYGGSDTYAKFRPFMIGMILGNIVAMLFWVIITFFKNGAPIGYWPA